MMYQTLFEYNVSKKTLEKSQQLPIMQGLLGSEYFIDKINEWNNRQLRSITRGGTGQKYFQK